MIVVFIVCFIILQLLFILIRLTMAAFFSWIYKNVSGSKTGSTSNEEQEKFTDDDCFVKPTSPAPKSRKTKTINRVATNVYFNKSLPDTVRETCREELVRPTHLHFKETHFDDKPSVALKVNTKKGKRKKSSSNSFEKIDKAEIEENVNTGTDSPLDNLGFSFFPVKTKSEESVREKLPEIPVEVAAKKSKKTSPKSQQKTNAFEQKIKIEDLPPSSIILHYQKKEKVQESKVEKSADKLATNVKTDRKENEKQETESVVEDQTKTELFETKPEEVVAQIANNTEQRKLSPKGKREDNSEVKFVKKAKIEITSEQTTEKISEQHEVIENIIEEILDTVESSYCSEPESTTKFHQITATVDKNDVNVESSVKVTETELEETVSRLEEEIEVVTDYETDVAREVVESVIESALEVLQTSTFEENCELIHCEETNSKEDLSASVVDNSEESDVDLDERTNECDASEKDIKDNLIFRSITDSELENISTVVNVSSDSEEDNPATSTDTYQEAVTTKISNLEYKATTSLEKQVEQHTLPENKHQSAAIKLESDRASLPTSQQLNQPTNNPSSTSSNVNQPQDQSQIDTVDSGRGDNHPITSSVTMESNAEVRVLTLNANEHQDTVLYRLEQNWHIQFRLGPSLLGRKVILFCNYPQMNQEFQRNHYYELQWLQDEGCSNSDDTALYAQFTVKMSGSFHYYFTYLDGEIKLEPQGSGFFLVDPILRYGADKILRLDCIQCQTVLAKSLGSFSTWENKLKVAKESGYNMIHFTPIQELGGSKSSYSLSEQSKLNPIFSEGSNTPVTFQDIEKFIAKLRKEWEVTSICDIVLNHTANESGWLQTHPEVTYNCSNCPYLRPAYLLDAAFHQFSNDVRKGVYENKGIPLEVNSEEHLNAIRYAFNTEVLPVIKIHELFICDVNKLVGEFLNLARRSTPRTAKPGDVLEEIQLIQDPEFKRLGSTIDIELALKNYNVYRLDCFDEESRIKRCGEDFKQKLDSLNEAVIVKINEHLSTAVENVIAGIRYFRVQADGPRIKEVSVKNPLTSRYFTDYGNPFSFGEHEEIMYSENGKFLMAHNGWVMNADPLKNFAASDSNVYLRRELIAWGDSVKLRYGEKPEDCPFLWEHMKAYVEQTARIFDGVRLDNCHSTPIVVAEYLLDCARKVRPDLYVVAELFTNSDQTDNIFVNRLGITSLIREAMSAWDSHEEGRLVYRYGGYPVGSFLQPRQRPLVPTVAHALFLDLTHDNPSPVQKRSIFDLLPSTALVNMACCASGSNRGYDELVPHHIHVVDETREYAEWSDDEELVLKNERFVGINSGIIAAKKAINKLHFYLGNCGFNQVYVDQMDPDVVAVTRHDPKLHESFILVAFTAFDHPDLNAAGYQRGIRPLRFEGVVDQIVFEATLTHKSVRNGGSKYAHFENFKQDNSYINGVDEYFVEINENFPVSESHMLEQVDSGTENVTQLNFKNFKPGSVVCLRVLQTEPVRAAIFKLLKLKHDFSQTEPTELRKIISTFNLEDLNYALYRCDQEERDDGNGFDVYNIPNFGSLVYAGFQGFLSLLANIRPNNDLGHPMCANLRDGNWMIDYIWQRLKVHSGTKKLGEWIEENTLPLKQIPRYLIPCYFDVLVTGIYIELIEQSYKLMSNFVNCGSAFVRSLALGSVQMGGFVKSAKLPTLSLNLEPPRPPIMGGEQHTITLSAGLPHFTTGYMRNWGRDTFIALRGLFILTNRHQEARFHILGYASCLRHGLIPNLLDGGINPRYNCRDAIWWWLYSIKSYVEEVPNGFLILNDVVSRIFPTDESENQPTSLYEQPLHDVIQAGLNTHFQGLAFRERNAGRQIDAHMTDRGFNNQIGVHPETGFVFGGNEWNCGTWMDKMGSSDKAGNRGKPATPRDGSAIEIIGLSKAVISWLADLHQRHLYPYEGVERIQKNGNTISWTFREWATKIQTNFEKYFWVNTTPVEGELQPDLINKRGIYKDSYGATQAWSDYQLRCNFPIAMVVAPELFNPKHAWTALEKAEKYLLGPLGMKTLDPQDWAYRGDYDNSNDSTDPTVAHGINYHQGPEWVWPLGFYLRAKLIFAVENNALEETIANTKVILSKHFTELQTSAWRGLPELTNKDGAYCKDSCRTQAWSMSCILEVLDDLQRLESTCN